MPISFPSSPSTNQTYSYGGRTYKWTGAAWEFVGSSGSGGMTWASVPASPTASGTAGDIAYDGTYLYGCTATDTWRRVPWGTWFDPTSISGLSVWLDASDAGSLYDATSGGSAVAVDGAVARWADKSGSGNHALQATSGSRPVRRAAGINGKPSIQFVADDADNGDWLGVAHASALNGTSGLAIFCVYKTASVGTNRGLIGKWPGADQETGPAWILAYTGSATGAAVAVNYTYDGTTVVTQATTSTFNDGAARLLGYVNTSAGLQSRMNGDLQGTASPTVLGNSSSTAGVVVGGYASYGLSSSQRLMSCHISELLIYSASLTSQQVADVEQYLLRKWGIA